VCGVGMANEGAGETPFTSQTPLTNTYANRREFAGREGWNMNEPNERGEKAMDVQ
jgi:hypothetical protein